MVALTSAALALPTAVPTSVADPGDRRTQPNGVVRVVPAPSADAAAHVADPSDADTLAADPTVDDPQTPRVRRTDRPGAVADPATRTPRPAQRAATRQRTAEPDLRLPTRWARLRWPDTRVRRGATARVTGRLAGLPLTPAVAGRRVTLQLGVPAPGGGRRWVWQRSDRTDARGRFALRLPTGWLRRELQVRLRVSGTLSATPATSPRRRFDVLPRKRLRGRASSWDRMGSEVFRFDPCRPITWRLNASGARPGARRDAARALKMVRRATGLDFVYRGRTRAVFGGDTSWPRDAMLVISWADLARTKWGRSRAVAHGGVRTARWAQGREGRVAQITQAGVTLDATKRFSRGFSGPRDGVPDRGSVLMHELAHAIGLGHVRDRRQMMYSTILERRAAWGAGDVRGLSRVGLQQGCLTG